MVRTSAINFFALGQVHGGGLQSEGIAHVLRNGVKQLHHVFRGQQLLAEEVEALDFLAPASGILGFAAGALRQPASQNRAGQKRQQGNPVLRIGDGKSPDRR